MRIIASVKPRGPAHDRFRNVGPQVFVSYCFRDKEIASQVSTFLTLYGCRVRMEDEVSLIGRRLDLILPERVGQAEAFVQLRTSSAGVSRWVAKELEYASTPRDSGSQPVLAPVAFEASDLAALPAVSRPIDDTCGLSDEVLEILVAPIGQGDWLKFVLTQIAFRAWGQARRGRRADDGVRLEAGRVRCNGAALGRGLQA
jgi:hypothetical protein